MYINPFVAGVVVTLLVEFVALVIYAVCKLIRMFFARKMKKTSRWGGLFRGIMNKK